MRDFVAISSMTGGDCHDAGATRSASSQTIGRVLSTNGSGGTYIVELGLLGIGTLYDTGSWSASARVREKKRPISAGLTSHFVRSWRTSPVAIPVSPTRKAACADSSKLFPYHRGTIVQL